MQSPGTERLRREVLTTARSKNAAPNEPVDYVYQSLKDIYKTCCRPVEEHYRFSDFFSPPLTDTDIEAKPFVLLLGQYSVGKTSFIRYLLGRDFPGQRVGPEPTTDRFVAIMHGDADKVTPGNALTS